MQIYIEYGTGTKIKNLSTIRTEQCYAPVFFDGPVDLEKLAGYLTYIGPDGAAHASFDPQAWEDYQTEQRELEARLGGLRLTSIPEDPGFHSQHTWQFTIVYNSSHEI